MQINGWMIWVRYYCPLSTDHWECDLLCDLMEVRVAFLDVVLSSGKVWTNETHCGVVKQEAHGNCSLVACCTSKTGLDTHNCYIPTQVMCTAKCNGMILDLAILIPYHSQQSDRSLVYMQLTSIFLRLYLIVIVIMKFFIKLTHSTKQEIHTWTMNKWKMKFTTVDKSQ